MGSKKRGRPIGYRLSEESKRSISASKTGQRHKQATKDKISRTLLIYFKNLHPLSEEITNKYCRYGIIDEQIHYWINDNKEEIDEIEDIRTERSMRNSRKIELAYGQNIEYFSHALTPERLMVLKERFVDMNINLEDII
jgi:hypothetical protein